MELRITGIEQVQRSLRELPGKIVVLAFAKALDRAAGVLAAEMESRAPERDEGLLKEPVVEVEVDVGKRGGVATIGYSHSAKNEQGVPADVVAMWVELGHKMIGHKPDKKALRGPSTPDGSVLAHPFMRPAFDTAADRAVEVFGETLLDGLSEMDEN